MAQNDNRNRNNPGSPAQIPPVDAETIKSWINNQTLELQNQKTENEIRLKEIEANTRLAEKSLEIQKDVLTNQGKDFRMSITRIGWIGGSILIILLTFLGFCLWAGKDQFAYKFGQGLALLITNFLSYLAGRKTKPKTEQNTTNNTDQVF
jgi:hypothetical protein